MEQAAFSVKRKGICRLFWIPLLVSSPLNQHCYHSTMASAIVIDGSNLCRAHKTKLAHLELLEKAIAQIETIMSADDVLKVYADASLPYGLNDPDKKRLEYLISTGKITKAPAGVEADGFILRWAAKKNAIVISNDLYRDYVTSFPWIKEKGSGRFVCGDYDEADKSWTFLERSAATTNARSIEQLINRPKSDPLFLDQSGIQSLIDSTPKPRTSQPSNKSKFLETLEPDKDLNQKLLFHDFVAIWGISRHNALTIINSEKYNQALKAPRNDHVIISGSRVQLTQHGLNTLKELAEVIRSNDPPPIHGRY
jgi:hypothetical protein